MENFADGWISSYSIQLLEMLPELEDIDNVIVGSIGDLNQAGYSIEWSELVVL